MTRFLPVMLIMAAMSTNASAQSREWKGFRQIKTEKDSPHAAIALKGVFKLLVPMSQYEERFRIIDVQSKKVEKSTKKLDRDLVSLQVETCRRYGLKNCPVSTNPILSTIFMHEPDKLYGCRHSFNNWLFMAIRNNSISIKDIKVPMIIKDHKDNIIYNSAYSKQSFHISFINTNDKFIIFDSIDPKKKKISPELERLRPFADFISIKFSEKVVDVIPTPIGRPVKGQAYAYGYPAKTNYFGGVDKGDTPGGVLTATAGEITHYSPYSKRFRFDMPSFGGSSGGPVLSEGGYFAAISCQGGKENSFGQVSDENELAKAWGQDPVSGPAPAEPPRR